MAVKYYENTRFLGKVAILCAVLEKEYSELRGTMVGMGLEQDGILK